MKTETQYFFCLLDRSPSNDIGRASGLMTCRRGVSTGTTNCTKLLNISTRWDWKPWIKTCRKYTSTWLSGQWTHIQLSNILSLALHFASFPLCPCHFLFFFFLLLKTLLSHYTWSCINTSIYISWPHLPTSTSTPSSPVKRQGRLKFRPPFEEVRARYFREMKRFISIPNQFKGVSAQGEEPIFSIMIDRNAFGFLTIFRKAEDLFSRLQAVQDKFKVPELVS